jgi:hypothetical protein
MKKSFAGYYRPSDDEFSRLWQDCIFVLDANVLLNVYRYSSKTQESFFGILEKLQDRLWLPHQAALEYHKNRLEVISDQIHAYDVIEELIDDQLEKVENGLKSYRRHPLIDITEIKEPLNSAREKVKAKLREERSKHPDYLDTDPLLDRLTKLFQDKVGEPYSEGEMESLSKVAEQRFKRQIPPGYKDSPKGGLEQYGDVTLWFQVIDMAKSSQKPVVLISEERKEDWWLLHRGKTIGPRPELIQEMKVKTGVAFYMYSTEQFFKYSGKLLRLKDQKDAIKEAKDVRENLGELGRRAREAELMLQQAWQQPVVGKIRALQSQLDELAQQRVALSQLLSPIHPDVLKKIQELMLGLTQSRLDELAQQRVALSQLLSPIQPDVLKKMQELLLGLPQVESRAQERDKQEKSDKQAGREPEQSSTP